VPEYGRMTEARPRLSNPPDTSAYPQPPWTLPHAEILQVVIEVDTEAALDHLPTQLSRPVPAYAKLIVARYPESPLGPFAEAMLMVACRNRARWLQFVAATMVDDSAVAEATAALWSYPREGGTIDLTRVGNHVHASVAGRDGPILDLDLANIYAVDPAMIRYDVTVTLRADQGGNPEVLIVSAAPDVQEGWLAKGAKVTYPHNAPDSPWTRLRNLNTISSTYALVNLEWPAPRAIDFAAPVGAVSGIP
jgi:Acetoacetate decarboxylase (ADC)